MKILSLNVAVFLKNNERIKSFLNDHHVDVYCFQEVVHPIESTADDAYLSGPLIDTVLSKQQSFFSSFWEFKDFTQYDFHGDDHFHEDFGGFIELGLQTWTDFEIPFASTHYTKNPHARMTDWSKWPESDVKGFQVVDVLTPKPLRIINIHGNWSRGKQGDALTIKASNLILEETKKVTYPSIVLGDFNLFPETESIQILSNHFESLVDTYRIKTTRPSDNELHDHERNIVDYIFVDTRIKVNDFQVINSDVSDHLPLIVDIEY